jgi:hypothetical protein
LQAQFPDYTPDGDPTAAAQFLIRRFTTLISEPRALRTWIINALDIDEVKGLCMTGVPG